MSTKYKRTEDPDVFLEETTQTKELFLSRLEVQLAILNKEIAEGRKPVPTDKVTAEQKAAIEVYNFQNQEIIRYISEERDRVKDVVDALKSLPQKENK